MINIQVDQKEINRGLVNALKTEFNRATVSAAQGIKRDLEKAVTGLLVNSPEYKSIQSGILKTEFAINNSDEVLHDILFTVKNSIAVSAVPVNIGVGSLTGGLNISILRNGIQDLISLSSGKYEGKLFDVPWLEWLLTQGDRIIIAGYNVKADISSPADLAGPKSGLKTGVDVLEQGKGWRIPTQFSGTESSNWITRTFNIQILSQYINEIVERNLKSKLS